MTQTIVTTEWIKRNVIKSDINDTLNLIGKYTDQQGHEITIDVRIDDSSVGYYYWTIDVTTGKGMMIGLDTIKQGVKIGAIKKHN